MRPNSTLVKVHEGVSIISPGESRNEGHPDMALTLKLGGAEIGQWTGACKRNQTQWILRHPSVVNSMGTKK